MTNRSSYISAALGGLGRSYDLHPVWQERRWPSKNNPPAPFEPGVYEWGYSDAY